MRCLVQVAPNNRITGDVFNAISNQLVGTECEASISSKLARHFYPDVVVACNELRFEDNEFDTLLNAIKVVEVLSPSV